jgi:thioesterase domain-containing protein
MRGRSRSLGGIAKAKENCLEDAMDSTARNTDSRVLRNQAFIAESVNRVKTWIAPLNVTGKRTPMFFVFPMSLDGACYVRLSEALGEDQPFYAFQVPSKERKPEIATSIPDIAACLITEFEKAYQKGDFILGGWSAGAIIALEMAQQLTRKGRPPALLTPIDHGPSLLNDAIRLHALWKKARDEKWKDFIPSPSVAVAKKIFTRIAILSSHAQRSLRSRQVPMALHPIQKTIDDARSPEMRELLKKLYALLIEYRPSQYDGPVLLFLSAQFPDFEWDRRWSVFAQNVKVCHFLGIPKYPTTHEDFIRGEHVDSFARALKEQIDLSLQRQGENQCVTSARAVSENALSGYCVERSSF